MKMENFKANYVDTFPLEMAVKIDDLIYYDMPILSRYQFMDKTYLFYHVDDENNLDTYLVFEVEELNLYKLISKGLSLRELILNINDFVYIIDKNYSNEIVKTALLHSSNIIDEYLPDADSILEINFIKDCYYSKLIEKFSESLYVEKTLKNAIYLKIASTNEKYGRTLGFNHLVEKALPKIVASYKNYSKIEFFKNFSSYITDGKKLNTTFLAVQNEIDYRIVHLNLGSFEIGLAPDTIMHSKIEDRKIDEWTKEIGLNFKSDVLDIDLKKESDVKKILEKFNDEERAKIFKPIIELSNDKDIDFLTKTDKSSSYRIYSKPSKVALNRILPPKKIDKVEDKEFELIQVTGIIEKGKMKSINLSDSLFSTLEGNDFTLDSGYFKKYGYDIDLDDDILVSNMKEDGQLFLKTTYKNEPFTAKIDSVHLDNAIEKIIKKIYEFYLLNVKED